MCHHFIRIEKCRRKSLINFIPSAKIRPTKSWHCSAINKPSRENELNVITVHCSSHYGDDFNLRTPISLTGPSTITSFGAVEGSSFWGAAVTVTQIPTAPVPKEVMLL
jgi:hypothetical protein